MSILGGITICFILAVIPLPGLSGVLAGISPVTAMIPGRVHKSAERDKPCETNGSSAVEDMMRVSIGAGFILSK